jgi:hypothetical protein
VVDTLRAQNFGHSSSKLQIMIPKQSTVPIERNGPKIRTIEGRTIRFTLPYLSTI